MGWEEANTDKESRLPGKKYVDVGKRIQNFIYNMNEV